MYLLWIIVNIYNTIRIWRSQDWSALLYQSINSRPFTDSGPWSGSNWWPDLNVKATMADDDVNQADIDDILNSPSKPPSKPSSKPSSKPPTPPSNNGGSNRGSKPTTPPTPTKVANYEPLPGKWVSSCVQKMKKLGLFWFWKKNNISKPVGFFLKKMG